MFPLGLNPLPISRPEGEIPESAGWDDFVSSDAVRQVLSGACSGRLAVSSLDFGLSSNDDDFAAVALIAPQMEPEPRVFVPVVWPEAVAAEAAFSRRIFTPVFDPVGTRATPPAVPSWDGIEAGLAARAGYRWWIPGIVGVAATFVLSAVLFLFSQQSGLPHGAIETRAPIPALPAVKAADATAEARGDQGKEPSVAVTDWTNP
ncbi:hypothetical protein KBB96_02695 [Luteolibacter ambystomatis]|uniref:Uncharacterized protein n=1 Tax=Luteolibacter ambystomatis TaxID=2824561 RepID=A0A975PFU6_9BACT|nr:hypothetical protein [Luteolibacter ambystomatis]QUE51807.1 hypothetical protein KBB96_02695 [Luteolibacter ambystomatis]